jgi:nitrate reductase NapAB chaperone NapD
MYIASMVVKVLPEKSEEVVLQLNRLPNVTTYGIHRESNIIVLAEARRLEDLENLTRYILNEFDGVVGVFPTYVASDEVAVGENDSTRTYH